MSEQLKSCPFCGGKPFWQSEHDADGFGVFWAIRCQGCGNGTQQHFVSNGNDCPEFRAEVRAAWNTRADDAALSRLRDTQRVLVEALQGASTIMKVQRDLIERGKHAAAWNPAIEAIAAALASVEEQPDSDHLTPAGDEEVTAREATAGADGVAPADRGGR